MLSNYEKNEVDVDLQMCFTWKSAPIFLNKMINLQNNVYNISVVILKGTLLYTCICMENWEIYLRNNSATFGDQY